MHTTGIGDVTVTRPWSHLNGSARDQRIIDECCEAVRRGCTACGGKVNFPGDDDG